MVTATSTLTADNSCQVYLLNDPEIVDADQEGTNLLTEMQRFSDSVIVLHSTHDLASFLGHGWLFGRQLVVPEQERGSLSSALGSHYRSLLAEQIQEGLHLVVHTSVSLIVQLTGWNVRTISCSGSPAAQDLWGGGFGHGPSSLPDVSAVICVSRDSLPSVVDGVYGSSRVYAWTAPFGNGRITYMGADYFQVLPEWPELLESSLIAGCHQGNTTTFTRTTVVTTTATATTSTQTIDDACQVYMLNDPEIVDADQEGTNLLREMQRFSDSVIVLHSTHDLASFLGHGWLFGRQLVVPEQERGSLSSALGSHYRSLLAEQIQEGLHLVVHTSVSLIVQLTGWNVRTISCSGSPAAQDLLGGGFGQGPSSLPDVSAVICVSRDSLPSVVDGVYGSSRVYAWTAPFGNGRITYMGADYFQVLPEWPELLKSSLSARCYDGNATTFTRTTVVTTAAIATTSTPAVATSATTSYMMSMNGSTTSRSQTSATSNKTETSDNQTSSTGTTTFQTHWRSTTASTTLVMSNSSATSTISTSSTKATSNTSSTMTTITATSIKTSSKTTNATSTGTMTSRTMTAFTTTSITATVLQTTATTGTTAKVETATSTLTADNSCQVYLLNDPEIVDADQEGTNLLREMQRFSDSVIVLHSTHDLASFLGHGWLFGRQLVVPEQERGSLSSALGSHYSSLLAEQIQEGLHLVVHTSVSLIVQLTGWNVRTISCSGSPAAQDLWGGGFGQGPSSLPDVSAVICVSRDSLPSVVDGVYGSSRVYAWTAPFGNGRITYMGADYFQVLPEWPELLESSLSAGCHQGNTTTFTRTTVVTTTATATTSTQTIDDACQVYLLNDPEIVDADQEGTNLLTEMQRFSDSVIVLHSTHDLASFLGHGWLFGRQLVVPEQERGSLSSALGSHYRSVLAEQIQEGLHLVVHTSVSLIVQLTGWNVRTISCSGSPAAQDLWGGGFGQGPSSLPDVSAVICVSRDSLPSVVDGVYGSSRVYAWTAPFGNGRITYMGADYFQVLPEWPELLKSSLSARCYDGNATTFTRTTVVTTAATATTPPVATSATTSYMMSMNGSTTSRSQTSATSNKTETSDNQTSSTGTTTFQTHWRSTTASTTLVMSNTSATSTISTSSTKATSNTSFTMTTITTTSIKTSSKTTNATSAGTMTSSTMTAFTTTSITATVLQTTVTTGTTAKVVTATSTLTADNSCQVYLLNDPEIVDADQEGTNLLTEMQRFSDSVIVLHSTHDLASFLGHGWPFGRQLVVPEQERGSLSSALGSHYRSVLAEQIQEGLHLVVHTSVSLIVQLTGWNVRTISCSGSPAAQEMWGGGFGQGPSSLPDVSAVICVSRDSLPSVVDGVYGSSRVYAWTAPFGNGRITYMGADYFQVLPQWPELLESSLSAGCHQGNTTTFTRTTVVTTTATATTSTQTIESENACQVYMLNDPEIVDADQEGINLLTEMQRFSDSVIVLHSTHDLASFLGHGWLFGRQLVVPEQERGSLSSALGSHYRSVLAEQIQEGLHLVVHTSVSLIVQLTGWNVRTISCSGSPAAQDLWGGGFGQGPSSLPDVSAVICVSRDSLPSVVDGVYGSGRVYAWTAPFGSGRITYMGADYFQVLPQWPELLKSSLSARCYDGNATTFTRTTVVTTAATATTPPVATSATTSYMMSMNGSTTNRSQTSATSNKTETSDNQTSSTGTTTFQTHWRSTTASTTVVMSNTSATSTISTSSTKATSNTSFTMTTITATSIKTSSKTTNATSTATMTSSTMTAFTTTSITATVLQTTVTTGTTAKVVTATSTLTADKSCQVYLLNDPEIVDADQEGTNLLREMQRFSDSVIVLHSTHDLASFLGHGWLFGCQLVVPEQERGSLSSALGSHYRSLLAEQIQEGLHLLVHTSVSLIAQLTGWNVRTISCSGSPAAQDLWGGGFGQGPSSLPDVSAVICVSRDSLPSVVDGVYGSSRVYAWTAPFGNGRITYMGADYFQVRPEWPELLESSLSAGCHEGNTTTFTRTTVVTTTATATTSTQTIENACQVYMLNDPEIVDADQEGTNLLTEMQKFSDSVIVLHSTHDLASFLGHGWLFGRQLVVPEQERGSLSSALGSHYRSLLAEQIQEGLHLVVHTSVSLIVQLTGWNVRTTSCSGSPAAQDLWGGGFGQGPSSLPDVSAVICVSRDSLPSVVDGVYGSSRVYAWTAPFGSGRITYMGADYFQVRPEWPELLESSLSARCYDGNTTTFTRTTVVTTTATATTSTPAVATSATTSYMMSMNGSTTSRSQTSATSNKTETFDNQTSSTGTTTFQTHWRSTTASTTVVMSNTSATSTMSTSSTKATSNTSFTMTTITTTSIKTSSKTTNATSTGTMTSSTMTAFTTTSITATVLQTTATTGTTAKVVTATSTLTADKSCQVYLLNDPEIVDADQEGTNLLTEMQRFSDSVIVLYSTHDLVPFLGHGWLFGRQLVVPEQERGSLSSALGSHYRSLLAEQIQEGLHLVVHTSVSLIAQLTGWNVRTTSCSGSPAAQDLRGGGFGQGPSSLPDVSAVICVSRESLPSVVDGVYGSSRVYAWTAPFGNGRITYMGADYFQVLPQWPELLESSLSAGCHQGNTTTFTRTTVVTTTATATTSTQTIENACQVYMLNDPEIVDADQEGTNLLTEMQRFSDSVIVLHSTHDLASFLGHGWLFGRQLVVPEQERGSLSSALGSHYRSVLAEQIQEGFHLVVHTSVSLIVQLTGWNVRTTSCSGSPAVKDLWGGGFGQGPSSLPDVSAVICVSRDSLPSVVDGVYGSSRVYAWTAPFGNGRITYMGADYFQVRPEWPELLESSLSARCYDGNTTTFTRTTVVTTTATATTPTPAVATSATTSYMMSMNGSTTSRSQTSATSNKTETSDNQTSSTGTTTFQTHWRSTTASTTVVMSNTSATSTISTSSTKATSNTSFTMTTITTTSIKTSSKTTNATSAGTMTSSTMTAFTTTSITATVLQTTATTGTTAKVVTATSTLTADNSCQVYLLNDPEIVDADQEGTNLLTEMQRFSDSVIVLHSTHDLASFLGHGWLFGRQLVVPEQERGSLSSALGSHYRSLLAEQIQEGLHLVVHTSVSLIAQLTGWNVRTTSCSGSPAAQDLRGGGFGQGPSSLPDVSAVICVSTDSLPSVVDGVYGSSRVYAWTAPFGNGRITYMGADYFQVRPEWPELLESSLSAGCHEGNTTTFTRTTVVTTTATATTSTQTIDDACQVYMLNDPEIVDADQEGTNLLTEMQRFSDSVIVLHSTHDLASFLGHGWLFGRQLVVPEQERGSLSSALGSHYRSLLAEQIQEGLHLVVHTSVSLIVQLTGWNARTISCSGSPAAQDLWGGGFGQGPSSLPDVSAVICVSRDSLPSVVDGVYGSSRVYAWTAPFGNGRITYMGADYFQVRPEWPELLESSLSAGCHEGNTTTFTRTTVVTTTATATTSTPAVATSATTSYMMSMNGSTTSRSQTSATSNKTETSDNQTSSTGTTTFQTHWRSTTASTTVVMSNTSATSAISTSSTKATSNTSFAMTTITTTSIKTSSKTTNATSAGTMTSSTMTAFTTTSITATVLQTTVTAGTTAKVETATSTLTGDNSCQVYMLNDPEIVDADQEGTNLLTEMQRFSDSVVVLHSTHNLGSFLDHGWLSGGQLVIPEQERGSLSSALGSHYLSLLAQQIQEGLHLVVHHHERSLIWQLTRWNVRFAVCIDSSASQDLWGGGFSHGPRSLPLVHSVLCVSRDSLPSAVDGVYGSSRVYAWTAPFGNGRITYMGADYFQVLPEWPELLESSLGRAGCHQGNTTTFTRTTAVTTTATATTSTQTIDDACQVYMLNDPEIVDADQEGTNLLTEMQKFSDPVVVLHSTHNLASFLDHGWLSGGQLVIPEQERGSLSSALGSHYLSLLAQQIQEGLHLVVHHHERSLIWQLTRWNVRFAVCIDSSASQDLWGGGFSHGPRSLPLVHSVLCVSRDSLPSAVDGVYGSSRVYAWTAPFGNGRITYMGADYFQVLPEWLELLESSLGRAGCHQGNTTTLTRTTVVTTTATATTSTQTIDDACQVYMLNDPEIVDADQEGTNLLTEMQKFSDSVVVLHSTHNLGSFLDHGWLSGGQLVIPEQERGSLSSALGSHYLSLLAQQIQEGLHLVVHHHERSLIWQLTRWNVRFAVCIDSSASQDLWGAGFSHGPRSLPLVHSVLCVSRDSLPSVVDGVYGSSRVYAWTAPFGKGRITYMGADYFQVLPEWPELLESSLGRAGCHQGNTTTFTRTSVVTTTATATTSTQTIDDACQVYILNDPEIVDADQEGTNLLREMQKFSDSVVVLHSMHDLASFLGHGWLSGRQLVVPEQERGSLLSALGSHYRSLLAEQIQEGLHLVVHTSVSLIVQLTGWNVRTTSCDSSAAKDLLGGGFGQGPNSLRYVNAVLCVSNDSLPSVVDGVYGSSRVYAWTAPFGNGRITYMGADYFQVLPEWPELLESSLSAGCHRGNTTTLTRTTVVTTTATATTSTQTIDDDACQVYMLNDPEIVDADQEGTNLLTEMQKFSDSVVVLHSTHDLASFLGRGWLSGRQLVVPEQERGSLSSALGSHYRSLLAEQIQEGLHLVVHTSVSLIVQLTGWNVRTTSCDSSAAKDLLGGGFGQGPSSLHVVNRVLCVSRDSLPSLVDGVYGSSRVYAWTAPFGNGRITYMGADYFQVLPEWPELLESSLRSAGCHQGNTTTLTRTTVVMTTATATTSTQTIDDDACQVYMLNDPEIVDADQEGTNLLTEMQKFSDSVVVLHSTHDLASFLGRGWLSGRQLVVPEQERGSLSSALGSHYLSLLAEQIQEGLHLVVHTSVSLIVQLTGWNVRTTSCDSSAAKDLLGGGFGQGPSSLHVVNRVLCVSRDSLPSLVDGVYGSSRVYAWTAPFGNGRITYMGADYFQVLPEWPELLESSLRSAGCHQGNTTTLTRTTVVTTTATLTTSTQTIDDDACQVYMLNDPEIVDADQEGTNLLTQMQKFSDSVFVLHSTHDLASFLGHGWLSGRQLVVPEQERGSLSSALGSHYRPLLAEQIQEGLHLVVHTSVSLIVQLTGWNVQTTSCDSSAAKDLLGGGFGQGPSSLHVVNRVLCVSRDSLPSVVDGVYGSSRVYAWTAPFGNGRITYMGADYFQVLPEWPELLESSLSAGCHQGNTTTLTRTTVVATTAIATTSTPAVVTSATTSYMMSMNGSTSRSQSSATSVSNKTETSDNQTSSTGTTTFQAHWRSTTVATSSVSTNTSTGTTASTTFIHASTNASIATSTKTTSTTGMTMSSTSATHNISASADNTSSTGSALQTSHTLSTTSLSIKGSSSSAISTNSTNSTTITLSSAVSRTNTTTATTASATPTTTSTTTFTVTGTVSSMSRTNTTATNTSTSSTTEIVTSISATLTTSTTTGTTSQSSSSATTPLGPDTYFLKDQESLCR